MNISFSVTCACDKIKMDNLELQPLNIFYDKTATVVGGKSVYQSGNYYLFWNTDINKWLISTTTDTTAAFTTNEVIFYITAFCLQIEVMS